MTIPQNKRILRGRVYQDFSFDLPSVLSGSQTRKCRNDGEYDAQRRHRESDTDAVPDTAARKIIVHETSSLKTSVETGRDAAPQNQGRRGKPLEQDYRRTLLKTNLCLINVLQSPWHKAEGHVGYFSVPLVFHCVERSSVFPVDLGLLQLVGIIDVNRLPLGVKINRPDATLAVTIAGCLGSAERQMHFGSNGRCVDIGDPCIKIADRRERLVHILRVQGR